MLSASDRIYEGDSVRFGNGISGTVERMGWMETILRQPDDSKLAVPNADLASQQVSNLSRIHRSQVKQTLRFQYEDVDKLPKLIEDIKQEIREACPMLIVDGSRPFRVHFTCYQDDHVSLGNVPSEVASFSGVC
jgi:small-conductance mechanosensitive channel